MAPKRGRPQAPEVICPPMPHAFKVLRDHGLLNGCGQRSSLGGPIECYKHQRITDEAVQKVAGYLAHTNPTERQGFFDKMMGGGATPFMIEKDAVGYQAVLADLADKNRNRLRRQDTVVMDANGVLHLNLPLGT